MKFHRIVIIFSSIFLVSFFHNCKKENTGNLIPEIELVNHPDSLLFEKDTCLNISCTAYDPDGEIYKIELYIDGQLKDTLYTQPFIFQWCVNNIDTGIHRITVKAYDNNGGIGYNEYAIKIIDYKEMYYGTFDFMTIRQYKEFYTVPVYQPDTFYYEGKIRQFQDSDIFNCEAFKEKWFYEKNQLISIEFLSNKLTVTKINSIGEFEFYRWFGNTYQGGSFTDRDTIIFFYGTGGLGSGYDYKIVGIRK